MPKKTKERMVSWVEEHLEGEPTLTQLSREVGYSPCYCSAKFHEEAGISFREYVARRRLTLAVEELRTTPARILDIAVKYGFSSHRAFTRAVQRAYGSTPSGLRAGGIQ